MQVDHPTVTVDTDETGDAVVIALVGPPASGKTTIRRLLGDVGVEGIDARARTDPKGAISRLLEAGHDCIVVEGPDRSLIETLAGWTDGRTLVLRVDTHSQSDWIERYVERELDQASREHVDEGRLLELREAAQDIDHERRPYPDHHVSVYNDDSVTATTLQRRLAGLVDVLAPDRS